MYNDEFNRARLPFETKPFEKSLTSGSLTTRDSSGVYIEIRDAIWGAVGSKNHVSGRVCAAETQDGRRSMIRPRVRVRIYVYIRRSSPRDVRIKERGIRAREIETRGRGSQEREREREITKASPSYPVIAPWRVGGEA